MSSVAITTNNQMQIENPNSFHGLSLHMYDLPPINDCSLSSICKFSEDRIRILKSIQRFFESRKDDMDNSLGFYDNLKVRLEDAFTRYPLLNDPVKDNISHWILKLAFTNDPAEEQFFYFYEKILFAGRLFMEASSQCNHQMLSEEKESIRNEFFLNILCQYAEKDRNELSKITVPKKGTNGYVAVEEPYIPVPFRFAMKALETYDADLRNGKAFITAYTSFMVIQELYEEILNIHKANLLKVSNYMLKHEPRLVDLIEALRAFKKDLDNTNELFYDKNEKFSGVTYENIPTIAQKHFPLCMLEIHESFKQVHSLKHWGRLQFGMFLKGIGMELKDTIRLFINELKKTAQGEKKVKEYTYYVEHMYGKQGRKTDYTPWSCQKVAGKAIPTGSEVYGCPFKFYSDKILKSTLQKRKGLSDEDIEEILEQRRQDFTLGCRKLFEITHPDAQLNKAIGTHPNGYFRASYWYEKRKTEKKVHFNNLTKPENKEIVLEQTTEG